MKVSSTERTLNYAILIVFSLIVLTPIFSILVTAFGPANAAAAREGSFHPGNLPRPGSRAASGSTWPPRCSSR